MAQHHRGSTRTVGQQRRGNHTSTKKDQSSSHIPMADHCTSAVAADIHGTEDQARISARCHGASGSLGTVSSRTRQTAKQAPATPTTGGHSQWQVFRHINKNPKWRRSSSRCLGRVQHPCQGTTCPSSMSLQRSSSWTAASSRDYRYLQLSDRLFRQQLIPQKTFREGKQ